MIMIKIMINDEGRVQKSNLWCHKMLLVLVLVLFYSKSEFYDSNKYSFRRCAIVLHIHKEHLDTMSLIDIANDFVKDSDHRMHVFGQFHQSDMRTCLPALTKSIGIQVDMNKTS